MTLPIFVKAGRAYINLALITDFRYDEEKDETYVGFVGEDTYRRFPGNVQNKIFANSQPTY